MKHYIPILALIIFSACKEVGPEQNIYFEQPQPINDSELHKIPSKFIGTYLSNDSVFLKVDNSTLCLQNNFNVRLHKNQLDSLKNEVYYRDNKYFLKSTDELLETEKFGDSMLFILKEIDTIFEFSKTQKAKKINGKLMLNTKDSIYWTVKVLSLERNSIKIQEFYADSDLKIFDSLTKIKSEVVQRSNPNYLVKPSRREMAKILKIKNLGSTTTFKKLEE